MLTLEHMELVECVVCISCVSKEWVVQQLCRSWSLLGIPNEHKKVTISSKSSKTMQSVQEIARR